MKIATSAYPLDFFDSWAAYEDKMDKWVSEAAGNGAELLVFPEYGAMELATLAGTNVAADLEASLFAVSDRMEDANKVLGKLAAEYNVHILGPSGPVAMPDSRPVNRAYFFSPEGKVDHQDKQIMTMFERDPWDVTGGGPLKVFETRLGKFGVLICYDSEFPQFGRALQDIDFLLVPSCTEALAGYWRVRIGAMARALENQCVSIMSSVNGEAPWSEAVETCIGAGGVYGPPDTGFPSDGVIAVGEIGRSGWTYAEIDREAVAHVRNDGVVRNRTHWAEQSGRSDSVTIVDFH